MKTVIHGSIQPATLTPDTLGADASRAVIQAIAELEALTNEWPDVRHEIETDPLRDAYEALGRVIMVAEIMQTGRRR